MTEIWRDALRVYTWIGLVLAGVLVITLIASQWDTRKIQNYDNETGAWICPGQPADAMVSSGSVSFGTTLFEIVLLLVIMYIALQRSDKGEGFIPRDKAVALAVEEARKAKHNGEYLFQYKKIDFKGASLVWSRYADVMVPKKWVVAFEMDHNNEGPMFVNVVLHAVNGKAMESVRREGDYTDADRCSRCGDKADEAAVMTDDLKDYLRTKKNKAEGLGG